MRLIIGPVGLMGSGFMSAGFILEVHEPIIAVLIAVLITTLGPLRGLQVVYRYSYNRLIRTMNLQVALNPKP